MSCFPCFQKKEDEIDKEQLEQLPVAKPRELVASSPEASSPNKETSTSTPPDVTPAPASALVTAPAPAGSAESGNFNAKAFTFRELASATKNFRQNCLIGEGGFGKVYKGTLSNGQVVAVKRLDRTGAHDSKEFSVNVLVLNLLRHPNLLNLIGYCADGEQRLLVYEYMPVGCLQDHLLDLPEDKEPLDWLTRMKIASGVAQGLEYLHEKANPSIIYRDLKSSNILLDEDFNPKLSDYGLAKLEGGGNNTLLTPRVMGTGYYAPEYERTGELTLKSDVYSFGVVLLELLSGRQAVDPARPIEEQKLVDWAQPIFRDPKRFPELADPLLKKAFPVRSLNQAVGVAAMCLQEEASVRPLFGDVVAALRFLAVASNNEPVPTALPDPTQPSENTHGETSDSDSDDSSEDDGERSYFEHGNSSASSEHRGDAGEGKQTEPRGSSIKCKSKPRSKNSISSSIRSNSSEDENDGLSSRRHSTAKAPQESASINLRNNVINDSDEDSDDLSFCYSVNASMNMRSNSITESNDGSFRSSLRQKSSIKSKNRSFGSYSSNSDEGSDEER